MALVAEYNQRARLRKLGLVENLDALDCIRADAFLVISEEIDKHDEQKAKASAAKAKGGSRNG